MNILLVNYEYTLTGASRLLLRLAEHLRHSGHQVTASAAVPEPGPVKAMYQERGFTVLDPPFSGVFDLAICNSVLTAPQLLACAGRTKTIWWIHEGSIGLEYLLRDPAQREAFARASVVVFPIEHLRDTIYRSFIYQYDQSRFVVIPGGIPPITAPGPRTFASTEFRIVSVGSIYPRKKHEDLIRAMMLYAHPSARCIIAGKLFSLPDDCMRIIEANPQIFELIGEIDNAAALRLLATADVFCLPSNSEVQPLTILEAAMLERPLLLSDLSVYEGMWRHGHNCLLYPVGAIGMLAQSIAMLAANAELRTRLGAAARLTAAPYTEAALFARFDAVLLGL
ncbi:MAG: glycosyltransferase family 4 protein [Stellaceae bacterium]